MTEVQSNASVGRPLKVPTIQELPPLVARSTLAIIDESVRFLRINLGMLLGITAVILLPLQFIVLALPGSALRGARPDRTADIIFGSLNQPSAIGTLLGTLVFESIALFTIATIYGHLASIWYSRGSISGEELLIASIKRSPRIVVAWAITHVLLAAAGALSLGAFAVIIGPMFMVVAPVMGAEQLGIIDAIKRSWILCSSRFIGSIILYVAVAVAGQVIDLSIRTAPTLILGQVDVPVWISSGVFDVVGSIVVQSFTAASAVVFYLDTRVRREGIDLTMAIDEKFAPNRKRVRRG